MFAGLHGGTTALLESVATDLQGGTTALVEGAPTGVNRLPYRFTEADMAHRPKALASDAGGTVALLSSCIARRAERGRVSNESQTSPDAHRDPEYAGQAAGGDITGVQLGARTARKDILDMVELARELMDGMDGDGGTASTAVTGATLRASGGNEDPR